MNLLKNLQVTDIYILLKSLYGLHQASLAWFEKLIGELLRLGCKQLVSDGSVFIPSKSNHSFIIILVYFDDMMFSGNDEKDLNAACKEFLYVFKGTNDGPVNWYLGVRINAETEYCTMPQSAYIREILHEHKMEEANKVSTPMTANVYDELVAHREHPVIDDAQYRL